MSTDAWPSLNSAELTEILNGIAVILDATQHDLESLNAKVGIDERCRNVGTTLLERLRQTRKLITEIRSSPNPGERAKALAELKQKVIGLEERQQRQRHAFNS